MKLTDDRYDNHAAVAFATAAIDRARSVVAAVDPELRARLDDLVRDLWAWQTLELPRGTEPVSEAQAMTLPSFRFYQVLQSFEALRSAGSHASRLATLLSGICDLLRFVVWNLDGVEWSLNPGLSLGVGEKVGEGGWDNLATGLEALARVADDPEAELRWQDAMDRRLARDHPGDPVDGRVGSPVSRDTFAGTP
jgi:hypothetical protein